MAYEVVFKDAHIADGTGESIYRADVGIAGGKITFIGADSGLEGKKTITLEANEVLCPGFIDGHSHPDKFVFYDKFMTPKLLQGVTTEVGGNCGMGIAPVNKRYRNELANNNAAVSMGIDMPQSWETMESFDAFLREAEAIKPEINMAFYVGHGALRIAVKGYDKSELTVPEMEQMKAFLSEALEAGAQGMSTGLNYAPGSFASHEEILELCKVLKAHNAIYATHMRDEGNHVIDAVQESLDVARITGVRLVISHHKVSGLQNAKFIDEIHRLFAYALAEGIDAHMDAYPWSSGATTLTIVLPSKYLEGGVENLLKRLRDPAILEKLRDEILHNDGSWGNPLDGAGFEGIHILSALNDPSTVGKSLQELSAEWGIEPVDTIFRILLDNDGQVFCRIRVMREEDVEKIFRHPLIHVITDSVFTAEHLITHPRAYATYPMALGRYVREKQLIPLELAIKKMTSLPADLFSFKNKGRIMVGKDADIVVFNRAAILDHGDYQNPRARNDGYSYVMVNGKIAFDHGVLSEQKAGKILRRGKI